MLIGRFEIMKFMADILLLTALYIGGAFALNTEVVYIATIALASISGSVVLAYFKRDRDRKEIFFKSAAAAMCGLVIGAIITRRYEITATEYVIGVYFFASLLSIFVIKGMLAFTEQNAADIVRNILQSLFRLRIEGEKTKNRVTETEKKIEQLESNGGSDNGDSGLVHKEGK